MRRVLLLLSIVLSGMMSQAQIYYVQDMSTVQIAALNRDSTVVLLPGSILEEHGPYLPSFTDGYMNQQMTKDIANSIASRPGMKVLIFPLIPLGNGGANEIPRKYNFSGTYTVRQSTLRSVLMDLSSEIGEQGFKKIFVIHMHGAPNHNQAIHQACDYFTETYKGRMMNVWNLAFDMDGDFLTPEQRAEEGFTVHSGTNEHSMLYYLQPQFQKLNYKTAVPEKASGPNDLFRVSSQQGWPGYWGSPRQASAELGKKLWTAWTAHILAQVNAVLDGKYDFSRPTFYQIISHDPDQNAVNEDARKHEKAIEAKQTEWLKSKGIE